MMSGIFIPPHRPQPAAAGIMFSDCSSIYVNAISQEHEGILLDLAQMFM